MMRDTRSAPAKRATALSIVFALAMGSLMGAAGLTGLVGNAAATGIDVDREFRLGVVDMSVQTLNPNVYTTAAERMVIFPCYSSLIQYDVDGELIGDLARSWSSSPDGLVWEFSLAGNAYFIDPENPTALDHPVTSQDVIFTYSSIIMEPNSVFNNYLNGAVESMWVDNPYHFGIILVQEYAPFLSSLANIPILPKYIWEDESLIHFENAPPVGSGPFFYGLPGLPNAGVAVLRKNPSWHMIDLHGWSPRVDTWTIVDMNDPATAYLELRMGNLDMVLNLHPSIYANELPTEPDLLGISQSSGFVYEFNINQMTDQMRASLGGAFRGGENNQLLLDPVVKAALSMCVDKEHFVTEVLEGLGSVADSLVPASSPWHYTYPDPIQFDPQAARAILWDAGWRYDEAGTYYDLLDPSFNSVCPLYDSGDLLSRNALSFRFYTLDTAPEWLIGSLLIRSWCEDAGMELNLEIKSVNEMNSVWYTADYDLWLWDWVFDPLADPSVDILSVMTTDAIGSWSDCFWSNAEFDDLYEDSLVEMDPDARSLILDEMQAMLYEDRSCQCVASRDTLNAMYTGTWTSTSDLSSKYMLLPEASNTWLSIDLYPLDNSPPEIVSAPTDVEGFAGFPVTMSVAATDDATLEYRYFWGDGTSSEWSSSNTASHVYLDSGEYTADVAVREASASMGFLDYFITSTQVDVSIYSVNLPPESLAITYSPVNTYEGSIVTFQGSAVDPEGDPMEFSWDFGDGVKADGQTVTHPYASEGFYAVTLYVTDNRLGSAPRPSWIQGLISVSSVNHPPSLVVPAVLELTVKTLTEFTVMAVDPDAEDTLTFVWDWGDGEMSFTEVPVATHEYNHKGEYTLTVTVADGTGLPGHSVSNVTLVTVLGLGNGYQTGGTRG
ncbi:MAG: ABC transporter substrate-binding protein [Thermoplasmata archaeon]|nr:ABC transporter substrate-binding protein [Thermoplasmata archaeon]